MTRVLLILQPQEPAIFSERAATEGAHRTRPHPTGSSLLGWAAARLYKDFQKNKDFQKTDKAYEVFHSGRVRFSDAVPLTAENYPAFRMPRLLVERKQGEKALASGILRPKHTWVGRDAFKKENGDDAQAEALKDGYIAANLTLAKIDTDLRLRTATEAGLAKKSALFGYGHIKPELGEDRQPFLYAATIEADDGFADTDWETLREAFNEQELCLGRAARTGYGGWYRCQWFEGESVSNPWPQGKIDKNAEKTGRLRVWVLSDLALIDDKGAPCFAPEKSEMLRLPGGGRLCLKESTIGTRRFAPWNRHLGKRDIERQVIEAGSVLTYHYEKGLPNTDPDPNFSRPVGVFQEQGLGRLWVDPPMLRGDTPIAVSEGVVSEAAEIRKALAGGLAQEPALENGGEALFGWAERMAKLANTKKRDDYLDTLTAEFNRIHRQTERDKPGPSPSQWGRVATAARRAKDLEGIGNALFDGSAPTCGRVDDTTRAKDWLMDIKGFGQNQKKVREWLKAKVEDAKQRKLKPTEVKWALNQLAKHAADMSRKAREKEDG